MVLLYHPFTDLLTSSVTYPLHGLSDFREKLKVNTVLLFHPFTSLFLPCEPQLLPVLLLGALFQ